MLHCRFGALLERQGAAGRALQLALLACTCEATLDLQRPVDQQARARPRPPLCPQLALLIKDKSTLTEEKLEGIKEIVGEEDKAREVIEVCTGGTGAVHGAQHAGTSSPGAAPLIL